MSFLGKQMSKGIFILSEVSQTHKDKHNMLSFIVGVRIKYLDARCESKRDYVGTGRRPVGKGVQERVKTGEHEQSTMIQIHF